MMTDRIRSVNEALDEAHDRNVAASALIEAAEIMHGRFLPGNYYLEAEDSAAVRRWLKDRAGKILNQTAAPEPVASVEHP